MLDKKAFKSGIQDLIDFYPSWGIKSEESRVMAKWYNKFKDCNDGIFLSAVADHIDKEKFNPTVATLRECTRIINANNIRPKFDIAPDSFRKGRE